MPRRLLRSLTLIFIGGFLVCLASTRWLRVNVSPSLPYGLYMLHDRPPVLSRGMLAVVPIPSTIRVFQHPLPLLKQVAATSGEWVCRAGEVLMIHGENYGRIYEAEDGHPLPSLCFQVPPDHVFLASHVDRSLDSRYLGTVPINQITAMATPFFTWGQADAGTHEAAPDFFHRRTPE